VEVLTNRFFVGPQHVEIPKRTVEVLASAAIQPTIVTLHVHPKVTRRGRVVDHRGRPMKGVKLAAILIDHGFDKPDATITERQMVMTSLGETRTDKNGEYQIELAPGTVLISAVRENYFPTPLTTRLEVQLENDERISDIVLHPIPALRGHVRTADQQSANDVIVKFETHGRADDEVMGRTNEAGEFQLRLPRIPYIDYGLGYDTIGYIAAMDPEKQVGGIVEVDLTDPEQTSNIVVNMEPQSSEWFFRPLPAKPEKIARLAEYVTAVRKKFSAGIEGNTVPAMSEGTWINTDATSLADFRGKFVLLDFWFIGCVPCEQAFPELKIVQQSFPSDQFAIVGVHPNSSPVDEVVEFVKQRRIPFAMVVDDRAGSIVKQYAPLGLSSYPEFILIDPNGRIVHNDAVCTGVAESDEMRYRSLRDNKLDLIREAIQNWDWERN
jgi:thiol-disulfide isomerase/thioredoxin